MAGTALVLLAGAGLADVAAEPVAAGTQAAAAAQGAWRDGPREDGLAGAEVRAVEVTADSSLWLAVRDRGLARVRGGGLEWVDPSEGLVSDGIAAIHEDASGRLWAAGLGGASVLESGRWSVHRALGDLRPGVVFGIREEPGTGAIWFATNEGAARRDGPAWRTLTIADGLPHHVVHAVVVDDDGAVWLACRRGLARVMGTSVSVHFRGVNFRTAIRGEGGTVWFGTPEGVFEWDGAEWTRHLEGDPVYPMLRSSSGELWAGSPASGLFRRRAGVWEHVPLPPRLAGAEVFDLAEARDGTIWVATARGVAGYVEHPG